MQLLLLKPKNHCLQRSTCIARTKLFAESRIITLSITGKVLQVTLQPNPARTYCVVKTNSEKATLAIVNFAGNIVYRQNLNGAGSHTINTSGIAKGVYVVRVVEGTESHSQKLVIE